jgi:phage gp36-like protein
VGYCDVSELHRWGVNEAALEDVAADDQEAALDAASDLIDSYLRQRYTLPLVSWGHDLKRACAIIAAWDLISARGYNPNDPADDNLRQRYEDTIAWLRDISAGKVAPQITDSTPGATEGQAPPGARVQVSSNVQRGWQDTSTTSRLPFSGGR